ncbi:MAG: GNAT family N-acetyltransferase [Defluviitaleaceae bacterium]|nr:GNAT family N-acetyltransferase [Defluviitaleaceae bacterium]
MTIYKTLDNGIKIVEYANAYAASLADMWNKSNDNWGGDNEILTERIMIDEHASTLDINTYLAIDNDEVVGYCGLAKYSNDPEALYIRLLNVRPDYMGTGVGKAMALLSVERTIELGNPRLDIHTWSGNIEAVPLYKKCGYLWEDRPNSTHLVNFIPTVLATPCFEEFFASADWYKDSTRNVSDIKPDGVKLNGFEVFGYSWEKGGRKLAVGFERSGRRIRFIETDDYIIEMMADSHELAFGMEHGASFNIVNKSGKSLDIAIKGHGEANIFADFVFKANVTGFEHFKAKFFVGAVEKIQDPFRLHPCILADVTINGEMVTFGLGINSKSPVAAKFSRELKMPRVGLASNGYINFTSALVQNCKVSFTLPKNDFIEFSKDYHEVEIAPLGAASVGVSSKMLKGGHIALPLLCKIEREGHETLELETTLHIINQNLSACFAYEDDETHNLICGPWRLLFCKRSIPSRYLNQNDGMLEHVTHGWCGGTEFNPPRIGKPYDDEFDHVTPDVRCFNEDGIMKMQTIFVSKKHVGIEVTQHFSLSPSGIFTRHHSIKNNGDKAKSFMLKDCVELPLGRNTYFGYNHEITNNADGLSSELERLDPDKFTTKGGENWVFENHSAMPVGIMWDKGYKPVVDWGSFVHFEHEVTELAVGVTFETIPYEFAFGVFRNYVEYRDYAMQVSNSDAMPAEPNIGVKINGHNSFVAKSTAKIDVSFINKRNGELSGKFILDDNGDFISGGEQAFPEDEICESVSISAVVGKIPQSRTLLVQSKLALTELNRNYEHALFFMEGEVAKRLDGSAHIIDNGAICFKADTNFADTLFSLVSKDTGQDWLFSNYPESGPHAWWNPFVGGLNSRPDGANTAVQAKEKREAEFVDICDNFGNTWSGIALTTHYNELEDHKGVSWVSHYLTLPGVPVLCSFIRFSNNTGHHKEVGIDAAIYPRDIIGVKCRCVNGKDHDFRVAGESFSAWFDKFIRLEKESGEFLHLLTQYKSGVSNDNKIFMAHFEGKLMAEHSKFAASKPMFYVLSKNELSQESLADLARVRFL